MLPRDVQVSWAIGKEAIERVLAWVGDWLSYCFYVLNCFFNDADQELGK